MKSFGSSHWWIEKLACFEGYGTDVSWYLGCHSYFQFILVRNKKFKGRSPPMTFLNMNIVEFLIEVCELERIIDWSFHICEGYKDIDVYAWNYKEIFWYNHYHIDDYRSRNNNNTNKPRQGLCLNRVLCDSYKIPPLFAANLAAASRGFSDRSAKCSSWRRSQFQLICQVESELEVVVLKERWQFNAMRPSKRVKNSKKEKSRGLFDSVYRLITNHNTLCWIPITFVNIFNHIYA